MEYITYDLNEENICDSEKSNIRSDQKISEVVYKLIN